MLPGPTVGTLDDYHLVFPILILIAILLQIVNAIHRALPKNFFNAFGGDGSGDLSYEDVVAMSREELVERRLLREQQEQAFAEQEKEEEGVSTTRTVLKWIGASGSSNSSGGLNSGHAHRPPPPTAMTVAIILGFLVQAAMLCMISSHTLVQEVTEKDNEQMQIQDAPPTLNTTSPAPKSNLLDEQRNFAIFSRSVICVWILCIRIFYDFVNPHLHVACLVLPITSEFIRLSILQITEVDETINYLVLGADVVGVLVLQSVAGLAILGWDWLLVNHVHRLFKAFPEVGSGHHVDTDENDLLAPHEDETEEEALKRKILSRALHHGHDHSRSGPGLGDTLPLELYLSVAAAQDDMKAVVKKRLPEREATATDEESAPQHASQLLLAPKYWAPDNLLRSLWRRWKLDFIGLVMVKVVIEALAAVPAMLLRSLLDNLASAQDASMRVAAYLIAVLVLVNLLGAFLRTHYDLKLRKISLYFRGQLSWVLYKHTLNLRHCDISERRHSHGDIINFMMVDANRICDQLPSANDLWSLPLQVCFTLILLYQQVKFAFVTGLAITLVLIPVNMALAKKIGQVNTEMLAHNDERVLWLNEVINNMKYGKMCGWSTLVGKWLAVPRAEYVRCLTWVKYLDAMCVFFWATTPVFVPLATFATYIAMGYTLEPGPMIAALALFNNLIMPLNAYPWVLNGMVEAKVSLERLNKFLIAFEPPQLPAGAGGDEMDAVEEEFGHEYDGWSRAAGPTQQAGRRGGARATSPAARSSSKTFRPPPKKGGRRRAPNHLHHHDDDENEFHEMIDSSPNGKSDQTGDQHHETTSRSELVLIRRSTMQHHNVQEQLEEEGGNEEGTPRSPNATPFGLLVEEFFVRRGQVVGISGRAGSGKTTFLSGLLGEVQHSTLHSWFMDRRSVAVVSQSPFILNASIKQNVIFGSSEYSAIRYDAALQAASLAQDVDQLPRGDYTVCGERGCALSGGQRMRVALARAFYADRDLYILDDPFGCLDVLVSRDVIRNFVLFLKQQGKALIVTTHNLEMLRQCDVIFSVGDTRQEVEGHVGSLPVLDRVGNSKQFLERLESAALQEEVKQAAISGATVPPPSSNGKELKQIRKVVSDEEVDLDDVLQGIARGDFNSVATSSNNNHERQKRGAPSPSRQPREHEIGMLLPEHDTPINEGNTIDSYFTEALPTPRAVPLKDTATPGVNNIMPAANHDDEDDMISIPSLDSEDDAADNLLHPKGGGASGIGEGGEGGVSTKRQNKRIEAEITTQGHISLGSIRLYCRHVGYALGGVVIALIAGMQVARNASDWYVAYWVSTKTTDTTTFVKNMAIIGAVNALLAILRSFGFARAGLDACVSLHDQLLDRVLGASFQFFSKTPPGQIINRLSRDVLVIDDSLPFQTNILLAQSFLLFGSIIVIAANSAWAVLGGFVPIFVLYYYLQRPYRRVTREVKRLESAAKSPLIDHLKTYLEGGLLLRAMGHKTQQHFNQIAEYDLEMAQQTSYNLFLAQAWFTLRLQLIGCAITALVGSAAVASHSSHHAGSLGLAIAYVGPLTGFMAGLLSAFTETEKLMVSVERVQEYLHIPSEWSVLRSSTCGVEEDEDFFEDGHLHSVQAHPSSSVLEMVGQGGKGKHIAPSWPQRGAIDLKNVTVQYQKLMPPVLNDVNLSIRAGEKVAIVGRTGAGKTTIFNAILRIVGLIGGTITIDGTDVSTLEMNQLRYRLGVLPQEPFIFHGSIRQNVDPFDEHQDGAILSAMETVGLRRRNGSGSTNNGLELDDRVEENGKNLSEGHRHLLTLVRVMLKRTNILLLDEPSSSIDADSDKALYKALASAGGGSSSSGGTTASPTIIGITHDLTHIDFYDRVVLIDQGRVVDSGAPTEMRVRQKEMFERL